MLTKITCYISDMPDSLITNITHLTHRPWHTMFVITFRLSASITRVFCIDASSWSWSRSWSGYIRRYRTRDYNFALSSKTIMLGKNQRVGEGHNYKAIISLQK